MGPALVEANAAAPESSAELRTQAVYGDELWSRLRELGLGGLDWASLEVMDACAGRGFLSFHILERETPLELTLVDVSSAELSQARELLGSTGASAVDFECADLVDVKDKTFDVVIGNSFMHHFPDVPQLISTVRSLLRPGGWFIGLHEPTPPAVALEHGSLAHLAACSLSKRRYTERLRYDGPEEVRPGTTDIWMFEVDDVEVLLAQGGFTDVRVVPRYLARPLLVAKLGMHLSPEKPKLSLNGCRLLAASVKCDVVLSRLVPRRFFGGLAFAARAPRS